MGEMGEEGGGYRWPCIRPWGIRWAFSEARRVRCRFSLRLRPLQEPSPTTPLPTRMLMLIWGIQSTRINRSEMSSLEEEEEEEEEEGEGVGEAMV